MNEVGVIGGLFASAKERLFRRLRRWAKAEEGRFVLWAPVLMIIGIGLYFQLAAEPPLYRSLVAVAASGGIWARGSRARQHWMWWIGRALFFVALGFALAQIRTVMVASPRIPHNMAPARIEGTLLMVEHRPSSQRFTLAPTRIGGLSTEHMPEKIRLTWRGAPSAARPGDIVGFRGVVSPPPMPTRPGGFDYGRQLYFEQIGSTGFALSSPRTAWRPPQVGIRARLEDLRHTISARILAQSSDRAGPILSAVVTGLRAPIPEETTAQLRDTGLAHLLAISGLHMGLVCGFIFIGVRSVLVILPGIALRYPVKKWAALIALGVGVVYLGLSGGAWSAQRAYIMAAISFMAILFDRKAISLRNVAVAAMVILLYRPEAALSAGFQMSFGAVTALVAGYEAWNAYRSSRPAYLRAGRVAQFFGGVFFTSFVAGLATAPFAIFHFGRMANYGLLANLAVMPLFTIGVMPVAVLGLLAMPIGGDGVFWWLSSHALDVLLWVTGHIAAWPGAVHQVGQWPGVAWLCWVGGMLMVCLLKAPWRWGGFVGVPLALLIAAATPQPMIYVAEGMKNIAYRPDDTGDIMIQNRRSARFAVSSWLDAWGAPSRPLREVEKFGDCTTTHCAWDSPAGQIVYARTEEEARRICSRATLVITPAWTEGRLERFCSSLVVSADSVSKTGPIAVTRRGRQLKVSSVHDTQGLRPWTDRHRPRE